MRKILSILIALGMILGLSVMAVPTGAATCTATVALSSPCADATGVTYVVSFKSGATLLPVNDKISVEFAAGTTFSFLSVNDVLVNDGSGDLPLDSLSDVVVTGTKVVFPVPVGVDGGQITAGEDVTVTIANVNNPSVAGAYELGLDYDLACCPGVTFDCADYVIVPAVSTYDFVWDSRPTYPGLAVGFIPPFKACGQETDGVSTFGGFNVGAMPGGKWLNAFSLLLMPTAVGCLGPCGSNVTVTLNLTSAPAGANITFSLNDTTWPAVLTDLTPTTKVPQPQIVIGQFALGANETWNWTNAIHFDKVGTYEICLKAICPATYTCPTCSKTPTVIADECFTIEVYQWKEACKIPLYRKWNLISLPLVPLEDNIPIADVLAAHPKASEIKSIHYYDRCADEWSVWGNGQTSLSTLDDGKAYWVKVDYVLGSTTKAPGAYIGDLWVWGTTKPVPPDSPSAYAVCDGWNMIGFTEGCAPPATVDEDDEYLWNMFDFWGTPLYGAVYGWNPVGQAWDTSFMPYTVTLVPGKGYWVSFVADGTILPP